MNQPSIIISTNKELALVCRLLFYQPTEYHSNPRKLWKDLKAEGYQFPYKKDMSGLQTRMNGKNTRHYQKILHRLVMAKSLTQIVYISAISYFLRMIIIKVKNG